MPITETPIPIPYDPLKTACTEELVYGAYVIDWEQKLVPGR